MWENIKSGFCILYLKNHGSIYNTHIYYTEKVVTKAQPKIHMLICL